MTEESELVRRRREITTRLMGSGEVPMMDIARVANEILMFEETGVVPETPPASPDGPPDGPPLLPTE